MVGCPTLLQELVKRITRKEKEAVHEYVYARGTRELLHVKWDGNDYWLESASGVSCLSSAYHRSNELTSIPMRYPPISVPGVFW